MRLSQRGLSIGGWSLMVWACSTVQPQRAPTGETVPEVETHAPVARRDKVVETLHGQAVEDPYRWLEQEKSPEVQAWMSAQDAQARAYLAALPSRGALLQRLKALAYVDSVGAPLQRGGRLFYLRTHADKEKAVLYWRQGEQGPEKVLLDPNVWTQDGTDSLGVWVPSPDGKKVAFTRKPNAADEATLHVVDVATGQVSSTDVIPGAKYAYPDWTPDSRALVYEWQPVDESISAAERPGYTELRLHRLGAAPSADAVLHPRTGDPKTFLDGTLSSDGRYLFVSVRRGWAENDVYWQRFGQEKTFHPLILGKGARYEVTAWKDHFYVLTDEGAPKYRVFRVKPSQPSRDQWREVVREDPTATLMDFDVIGGQLALTYLKDAITELRLTALDGTQTRSVQLPGLGTVSSWVGEPELDTTYFQFSSFTVPRQVYKTSVKTGAVSLWAAVHLPIDPSPFLAEQKWFASKDGTQIPMFIIRHKSKALDAHTPTLLTGYGGFNVPLRPEFRASIYPWLEAGGIYAVANLRGGGEYGKAWHEAGWRENKQNVFDDFIAASEFLIREKYTSPEKLAISGRSNGGLLVGAAMTQRPDLYAAVLCGVPLLDMVRYHRFGSGMTWIPEYGSADDAVGFRTLYAYSPYHHVAAKAYPALLMLSADHDDRVDPLHARKFVAAVQGMNTSRKPVLLRIETNSGHGGGDQVKKLVEQMADEYAFLMNILGMEAAAPTSAPRAERAMEMPARGQQSGRP